MVKQVVVVVAVCVIAIISSCKKITEDQLVNGLWRLDQAYVDTISTNYLNNLPSFAMGGGCCTYKVDFEDDGSILAYYQVHDSIQYLVYGHWDLNAYNQVYMQFDRFVDGNFSITKPSLKHWTFTSTKNHVGFYDTISTFLDTGYCRLEMHKI